MILTQSAYDAAMRAIDARPDRHISQTTSRSFGGLYKEAAAAVVGVAISWTILWVLVRGATLWL